MCGIWEGNALHKHIYILHLTDKCRLLPTHKLSGLFAELRCFVTGSEHICYQVYPLFQSTTPLLMLPLQPDRIRRTEAVPPPSVCRQSHYISRGNKSKLNQRKFTLKGERNKGGDWKWGIVAKSL